MATHRSIALAPWSASKVQTALRCAKLFHYRYIEKRPEPEVMPETRIGKAVHTSLEHALLGMPIEMAIDKGANALANADEDDRFRRICKNIAPYLQRVATFRNTHNVEQQLVEFRLGMDVNGQSIAFSAKQAFFRGIIDVAYSYDAGTWALVDHKSGIRQPNLAIVEQLEGYAVLAAVYLRNVRRVRLGIHWILDASVDWAPALETRDINERVTPKIMSNIEAAALAVADGPRADESSWCLRCSYRSVCPQAALVRFEPDDPPDDPGIE